MKGLLFTKPGLVIGFSGKCGAPCNLTHRKKAAFLCALAALRENALLELLFQTELGGPSAFGRNCGEGCGAGSNMT